MNDERLARAKKIIDYALFLRMYGERAPGGNETWREFDRMAEHFLRELPYPDPRDLEPLAHVSAGGMAALQEEVSFYKHAAFQMNAEIEDTLAPALGYEEYPPGSPGYSVDKVNYATGEHTAESLAFAAADKIEQLRSLVDELDEADEVFRQALADLMGHFEADTMERREFIERMSNLLTKEKP